MSLNPISEPKVIDIERPKEAHTVHNQRNNKNSLNDKHEPFKFSSDKLKENEKDKNKEKDKENSNPSKPIMAPSFTR